MEAIFGSNPLSTPVGKKIERATDEKLADADWAVNMEICDMINSAEDGPRCAIKAIRKRLSNYKASQQIMYTLTLLETCVKNCGQRFHACVAQKDFVSDLSKLVQAKNQLPTVIIDRILGLIQSWADAFQGQPELIGVVHLRDTLVKHGVEFPPQDLDSMSPIYTPERSVPEQPQSPPMQQQGMMPGMFPQQQLQQVPPSVPTNCTPEQLAKIHRELSTVNGNVQVMNEMMTEMSESRASEDDLSLLMELSTTCREMQSRVTELIVQVSNEELISELLKINDDLNNAFLRYERFERQRSMHLAAGQQSAVPTQAPASVDNTTATQSQAQSELLIDISDSNPNTANASAAVPDVASQLSSLSMASSTAYQPPTFSQDPLPDSASVTLPSYNTAMRNVNISSNNNRSSLPPITAASTQLTAQAQPQDRSQALISFTNESSTASNPPSDYVTNTQSRPMSDSLAYAMNTRNPNFEPPKPAPNPGGAKSNEIPSELEAWLKSTNEATDPAKPTQNTVSPQTAQAVSSSEFDKFLASRVSNIRQQPNTAADPAQASTDTAPKPKRQMQMAEADSGLFGL